MTDRELLEFAAKAAGISGEWARWHQAYGDEWIEGLNCGGRFLWNPLTDDGDALRLAVKLGIQSCWFQSLGYAIAFLAPPFKTSIEISEYGNDPYAATRRAIVRAAAAIWEAMP